MLWATFSHEVGFAVFPGINILGEASAKPCTNEKQRLVDGGVRLYAAILHLNPCSSRVKYAPTVVMACRKNE